MLRGCTASNPLRKLCVPPTRWAPHPRRGERPPGEGPPMRRQCPTSSPRRRPPSPPDKRNKSPAKQDTSPLLQHRSGNRIGTPPGPGVKAPGGRPLGAEEEILGKARDDCHLTSFLHYGVITHDIG